MIDRIEKRIEQAIYDSHGRLDSPLHLALGACSLLYGVAIRLRNRQYDAGGLRSRKLNCAVLSVGNLTVGGTGKTPMVAYLAAMFARHGLLPVVLSRGYGGKGQKQPLVVSDGHRLCAGADIAGDEPVQLAGMLKSVPVVVARDRHAGGRLALAKFGADILLLDDGFQHRRLHRDYNLLLMDGRLPLGNGRLLPRGPLRELQGSIQRADAIVFTRWDRVQDGTAAEKLSQSIAERPVFHARHRARLQSWIPAEGSLRQTEKGLSMLSGKRVCAFSAIADNEDFFSALEKAGAHLTQRLAFRDHYAFGAKDMQNILAKAAGQHADMLCTTSKDWARIRGPWNWPLPLAVIGVDMDMGDAAGPFETHILDFLATRGEKAMPASLSKVFAYDRK